MRGARECVGVCAGERAGERVTERESGCTMQDETEEVAPSVHDLIKLSESASTGTPKPKRRRGRAGGDAEDSQEFPPDYPELEMCVFQMCGH